MNLKNINGTLQSTDDRWSMQTPFSRQWHRVISFSLGLGIALGLGLVTPASASFIPLVQLLLQGGQYLQLANITASQKVKLGQEINQQLHQQYKFDTAPKLNAYVNRVGQRIAHVSDCPHQFPFHYQIVEAPQENAFATTGGFVYVTTGLLKAVGNNEAELAGVLGHETGHICDNDLIHKMQQVAVEQGLETAIGVDRNTLVNLATQLAVNLPNSRQMEFNADAKGQKYLERAGYSPYGLVAFLKKLLNQQSPPVFLSDHPGTKDRIAVLDKKIASGQS
jgi:predicted Zn-dependent protease